MKSVRLVMADARLVSAGVVSHILRITHSVLLLAESIVSHVINSGVTNVELDRCAFAIMQSDITTLGVYSWRY